MINKIFRMVIILEMMVLGMLVTGCYNNGLNNNKGLYIINVTGLNEYIDHDFSICGYWVDSPGKILYLGAVNVDPSGKIVLKKSLTEFISIHGDHNFTFFFIITAPEIGYYSKQYYLLEEKTFNLTLTSDFYTFEEWYREWGEWVE